VKLKDFLQVVQRGWAALKGGDGPDVHRSRAGSRATKYHAKGQAKSHLLGRDGHKFVGLRDHERLEAEWSLT